MRNTNGTAFRAAGVASTTSLGSVRTGGPVARSAAVIRNTGAALLCLTLCLTAFEAAAADDVADLKRAIEQLQEQNREMAKRITALEAEKAARQRQARSEPTSEKAPPRPQPKPAELAPPPAVADVEQPPKVAEIAPAPKTAEPPPPATPDSAAGGPAKPEEGKTVEQRVKDLETTQSAQEGAVRSIIQSTLSTVGSRINEFVSLGGSIEVTAGRESDFSGALKDSISLSTAEVDLDIKAADWVTGYLSITYDSGTNVLFPTTPTFNTGVDRLTLDKGYVAIGDVQRFPLFAKAGLDYLTFGTSTGVHRTDVLSIVNPLTVEAFEMRKPGISIGFALPTPTPLPPAPGIVVPTVRPLALNPLISAVAGDLGYQPPPVKPKPPTPVIFLPEPPPFSGILTVYDPSATDVPNRRLTTAINARLSYRAHGTCGRPYSELGSSFFCPWAIDFDSDYDSSVFDSRFLQSEYQPFLSQIGTIPGIAESVKMSLGRFLVVGEWDAAIKTARFVDGSGRPVQIKPSAWQVALGYQFDWNPWVETIGAQGDFVAFGFSGTTGLAGVTGTGTPSTRVGTLPQYRMSLTYGEWLLESTKLAIEYSHNWDYPVSQGGTGKQADGFFISLTYNF